MMDPLGPTCQGQTSIPRQLLVGPNAPSGADLRVEDRLVRRRRLATDYEYSTGFGISIQFGSIFNNVVNSRFAGSTGGIIRKV